MPINGSSEHRLGLRNILRMAAVVTLSASAATAATAHARKATDDMHKWPAARTMVAMEGDRGQSADDMHKWPSRSSGATGTL